MVWKYIVELKIELNCMKGWKIGCSPHMTAKQMEEACQLNIGCDLIWFYVYLCMQELEERDKQIIHRDAPKLLSPGLSFPLSSIAQREREREREASWVVCESQVREFWSDANNHMVRKKTPKKRERRERERESVCVCVCVSTLLFSCITSGLKTWHQSWKRPQK